MSMRIHWALSWTLLVAPWGCQTPGSANQYVKIDDMENGGAEPGWGNGCRLSWFTSTYSGWQNQYIVPPIGGWTFEDLNASNEAHGTMPGVLSNWAARLRSTQPLDTTPDKAQPDGQEPERLWGANISIDLAQVSTLGGGAGLSGDVDAGAVNTPQCPLVSADWSLPEKPVDLSAYSGLVFWAKADRSAYAWPSDGRQPSQIKEHRIQLLIRDRYADPRGQRCLGSPDIKDTRTRCWNAFSITLDLTESFARYEIDFSKMWRDPTWGLTPDPYALDLSHVFLIAFEAPASKCVADQNAKCAQEYPPLAFDFWIDDLYLVKHGG